MFIKEAVVNAGRKLFTEKQIAQFQNGLLAQWLMLATIKNYIYSWVTEEKVFLIPEPVRQRAARRKLILVLDMDETLVYTRRSCAPSHYQYAATQFDGEIMYVEPRPLAKEFLQTASQIFTIYIYTAGRKGYADSVLRVLDPENKYIERRFYRQSCRKVQGKLVKDLKYLKKTFRIKEEMILVDDNSDSINHNYPFALKIEAFEGDQNDRALIETFEKILRFYR